MVARRRLWDGLNEDLLPRTVMFGVTRGRGIYLDPNLNANHFAKNRIQNNRLDDLKRSNQALLTELTLRKIRHIPFTLNYKESPKKKAKI